MSSLLRKAVSLWRVSPRCAGPIPLIQLKSEAVSLICKRRFVSEKLLGLSTFDERFTAYTTRYETGADDLKSRMEKALNDPTTEILFQDAFAYIYLAEKENISNFVPILTRCKEQVLRDEEFGVTNMNSRTINRVALQKCYRLDDANSALSILKAQVHISDGFPLLSHILVMDLLIKNSRFQDCLDLAMTVLEEGAQIRSNDFYKMAIFAAYKLNNGDGLTKAAKLYDLKRIYQKEADESFSHWNRTDDTKLRRLMSLYCIKQNHFNAALTLANAPEGESSIDLNLKVLAYMRAGNLDQAVRYAKQITVKKEPTVDTLDPSADTPTTENSRYNHRRLFRDVFFELRDGVKEKEDSQFQSYLRFLTNNYDEYVSPLRLPQLLFRGFRRPRTDKPKTVSELVKPETEEVGLDESSDESSVSSPESSEIEALEVNSH